MATDQVARDAARVTAREFEIERIARWRSEELTSVRVCDLYARIDSLQARVAALEPKTAEDKLARIIEIVNDRSDTTQSADSANLALIRAVLR